MKSRGACAALAHPFFPASYQMLERDEDQVHPGEGSA